MTHEYHKIVVNLYMCPDLYRRPTEAPVQPGAQLGFLSRCHARLTTLPPIGGKRVTAIFPVGSCTSRGWCRRPSRETSQSARSFHRHPAASHWRAAQHHDLRVDYEHRPQALDGLKHRENHDGSCPYMKRSALERQPVKVRLINDSKYTSVVSVIVFSPF